MKRLLLTLTGIVALASTVLADRGPRIDLNNAPWKFTPKQGEGMLERKNARKIPSLTAVNPDARELASGTKAYIGGLQSFEDYEWNFTYTDGIFTLYPMEITRDGDKIIFTNMLNYDDEFMAMYGYASVDVEGTYDEAAGTITVKTPHSNGYEMTEVGKDDYTSYCLVAGRMEPSMDFWPEDDELVFHVDEDFSRIYTSQNIGVISVYDGEPYYLEASYASLVMQAADSPTPLIPASTVVNLGESYPGNEMTGSIQLLNMSRDIITFALAVADDNQNLTFDVTYGTVYGLEGYFIGVYYKGDTEGEFNVPVRLSYETSEGEREVMMNVTGTVKPNPDFSAIVTEGNFNFTTGNAYPFVLKEENPPYVWGPQPGTYQTSWMEAKFDVEPYHTGELTLQGSAFCTEEDNYYASNTVRVIIDGEETCFETKEDAGIDLKTTVGPGQHSVRVEYSSGYVFATNDKLGVELTGIGLSSVLMEAEGVEMLTPVLDFGGLLLDGVGVSKELPLIIRNMGANPLSVQEIQSSDAAFAGTVPEGEAELMEDLNIPITFTASEAGEYTAHFTIVTSAGPVEAEARAVVREMPDFSVILDDPDSLVKVSTTEDYPFVVSDDGYAYNVSSSMPDDKESVSSLTFEVTVPENNIAYVSWDGEFSAGEGDTGSLQIIGPSGSDVIFFRGEAQDIGSEALYPDGNRLLEMVPGVHTLVFTYTKNGDGSTGGKDMMTISNFTVTMEDFDPLGSEVDMNKIRFADCLLPESGHNLYKSFHTVYISNNGAGELRVLRADELDQIPDTAPFGYIDPGYVVYYGNALMVDMVFYPETAGDFEGTVTIPTTFGDFDIDCFGRAYVPDGMPLVATFDNAEDLEWKLIDTSGEDNGWFNVKDKYLYRPSLQCFSGDNALMSNGLTEALPAPAGFYAVSPAFDVPSDGGVLSWWTAPAVIGAETDGYEVCVVPSAEYREENLVTYQAVVSATVDSSDRSFKENQFDLEQFAGKSVQVIFRHKPVAGGCGIRLDDVFAFSRCKWNAVTNSAVDCIWSEEDVVETVFYDLSGVRIENPASGIVLRADRLKDGRTMVRKVINP